MPKFAANLSTLFTEVPFLERFEPAARAGFTAVEFQFPYAHPAAEIRSRLDANGLCAVLFNLPPGAFERGERGLACLLGREVEFRASLAEAARYASVLGVTQLHCMAGNSPVDVEPALVRATYLESLRSAARELGRDGIRILIEPLNAHDMPAYHLTSMRDALTVVDAVAADNLLIQYDIYHAQRSQGELAATLERQLARIGHIQIADNPGRHEPGSGEINFAFLFAHIDRIGYAGHVGCEYSPAAGTEAGLGWLAPYREPRAA